MLSGRNGDANNLNKSSKDLEKDKAKAEKK